jgi:hypothetical protein
MGVERAILKAQIADVVEMRNMFTCNVVESGGDDSAVLWLAYMSSILDTVPLVAHETVHFYEYEVQEYSAGDWVPKDAVTIDETGNGTGDALPNQSAIVFIAKAAGLHGLGRKFFGTVPESLQVGGLLIAGAATLIANILEAYITPFTGIGGGTITPGVLDKTGTFRPFVSGFVSSLLGTMRRRKPGIGI